MNRERLIDLDRIAFERNLLKGSGFLSLHEQSEYHALEQSFSSRHFLEGGFEDAERKLAVFLPDYLEAEEAASELIAALRIAPLNAKFSNQPTHRDYLGAILNLGIERDAIGDILVRETEAYVFCTPAAAGVLISELVRVSRTSVSCCPAGEISGDLRPETEELSVNVASERLDAVAAQVFHISRTAAQELCEGEKVFVDGRIASGSRKLSGGERVSVRGYGKFLYDGQVGVSRKDRLFVRIRKYI